MNATADDCVIRLEGLTKRFGTIAAVDDVSLAFQENEFFALLGPSGCGKTTLLRLAAGFEMPDEGRVLLDGNDITRLRPNRRPVNLMFQSYALFPHMSVRRNIAYGLEMEGIHGAALQTRVDEAMETTQMVAFADRKPDQLSGGQKQRVALARALIKRPRVLLLDEPLGALDKKLRGRMQLELKRLQHEVGITFIVVTHDQEEALVMADRVALMDDGVIVQCGAPRDLYEDPRSRFVADFIGVTNFFEGVIAQDGLSVLGLGLLRGAVPDGASIGVPASLAVRPERLSISVTEPSEAENQLQGRIVDVAYHGQDVGLHLRFEDGTIAMVRISAADEFAGTLDVDSAAWCAWGADQSRILMT